MSKIISRGKRTKFPFRCKCEKCKSVFLIERGDIYRRDIPDYVAVIREDVLCSECPVCNTNIIVEDKLDFLTRHSYPKPKKGIIKQFLIRWKQCQGV